MEIVIGIIVAIVLLIFLTGKKRRANTISKEIYSLIRSGQNKNILHHIYFEAALKFALEHGGELERGERAYDATSISFKMNIDGTNYFIYCPTLGGLKPPALAGSFSISCLRFCHE